MIGRASGLLLDFPVEIYAGQWRATARSGIDLRRTRELLARDLDALASGGDGYVGPLKLQAAGPWTLAASLDLPTGGRVLRDRGATRDLAVSLAEGLRAHVDDVMSLVPGATILLQLDEPSLPAVLAGMVPTESGLAALRPVEVGVAETTLRSIVEAVGVPLILHCCATGLPLRLVRAAGAVAASIDLSSLDQANVDELDALGEFIDAGLGVFAGVVSATPPADGRPPSSARAAEAVTGLWRRLGFGFDGLSAQVVITPACGLAGASPEYARAALAACLETAKRLYEYEG